MAGSSAKEPAIFSFFRPEKLKSAEAFLSSIGHSPTPLLNLPGLAESLGLGKVMIKDESSFMGLGAFKGRGGIWSMANILASHYGLANFGLASLRKTLVNKTPLMFVTATDGNHGKAVAWAAQQFGQQACIFMPKGADPQIVAGIEKYGAVCRVLNLNYDDTVRMANDFANSNSGVLIQDTAWPGYETCPAMIMQGYGTMVSEIIRQADDFWPDYILLQAGVGSFAVAFMVAFILESRRRELKLPHFISLEPKTAACVYESIKANDGKSHEVRGDLTTFMTGLSCGKVSSLAWPILRDNLFAACACSDELAHRGMKILASYGLTSGPSGAIGAGFLDYVRQDEVLRQFISAASNVLLVSTEK